MYNNNKMNKLTYLEITQYQNIINNNLKSFIRNAMSNNIVIKLLQSSRFNFSTLKILSHT